jgi:hypothetical protein
MFRFLASPLSPRSSIMHYHMLEKDDDIKSPMFSFPTNLIYGYPIEEN